MPRFHTEITASASQFNAEMEAAAQKSITTAQATQSAWRESWAQMGQNVASGLKQTQGAFDGVKAGIVALRGVIAGVGVAITAGLAMKKFADDSMKATLEVEKLATMLGITTREASALKVALGDVGSDTDTYVTAVSRLTVGLRENEERFNQLGVKTRGANGQLLSTEEIMQNAFSALMQFKEGTDRNLASTELFGKSWTEVLRIMEITPAALAEADAKAQSLQTTIGSEGVARAKQYHKAMGDVKGVIEAIGNRIGQALMPVLSDLGNWFSSIGPHLVNAFRGYMLVLLGAFYALENGIVVVVRTVSALVFSMLEPLAGIAEAIALAISGNFAEAGARLRQIAPNVRKAWAEEFDAMAKNAETAQERMLAALDFDVEQGGTGPKTGGNKPYTPKADKAGSRVSGWDAELAAQRDAFDRMKLEQGSFEQFSKQQESAYWKNILDTVRMSTEERAAVSKKYYDAEREIRKQAFDAENADIKTQIEAHKQGSAERIRLAQEVANRIADKQGIESAEFKKAQGDVAQYRREAAEQRRSLEKIELESFRSYQLNRVELERANLDTLETLGVINAEQKLARLRELKEIEFQTNLKAAQEEARLLEGNVIAHREALKRIEELYLKRGTDQEEQNKKEIEERKKAIAKWVDPFTDAIQTMVNGVLQGTQRLSDIWRNALRNLAAQGISMLIKMAADEVKLWILKEYTKTGATVAGAAVRTAAETSASAASKTSTINTAIMTIGAKAWEAAASVYASIAQIPYVGPFLAPAMALAAAGMIVGFVGKIASAAGGYDVPKGINPVTQIHGGEMVLPETLADRIRGMTGGPGEGGGAVNVHIHALDGESVERLFRKNGRAIVQALVEQRRNFNKG